MPTFNIITLKGAKGSIELEASQTVDDLYSAVKQVVGWTDAEDDYYVLIVSGKKLVDVTIALNVALPNINSPKIQVIVTKLSKPLSKSKAPIPSTTPEPTMTDIIASTPITQAPAVETTKPIAPSINTPSVNPTPTTTTPASPATPTPSVMSPTPTSTTSPTPTTPTTDIDFENFPKDLDFLPLLFNRDNFESFMENLSYVNPDVAAEIEKSPHQFMMAVETFTRAAHNPDFNPQTHITAIDQQFAGAAARSSGAGAVAASGAPAARPAPRQQAQQSSAMAAQLSDAEKTKVQQLVELGFTYNKALQAFIICDKNEEYAANYLFEHME